MEKFIKMINGEKPETLVAKRSVLDVCCSSGCTSASGYPLQCFWKKFPKFLVKISATLLNCNTQGWQTKGATVGEASQCGISVYFAHILYMTWSFTIFPQPSFTCSKLTMKTPEQSVKNVFKVNNKDTRTVSVMSFRCIYS